MIIYQVVFLHTDTNGKPSQLWDKGKANAEGYFTLKNSKRILTANFAGNLELKGKQKKSKHLKNRKYF